jgi:formylglycine-generating enzyme
LSGFGWVLTVLAVGTVSVRSHAEDGPRRGPLTVTARAQGPELLPQFAKREATLFGSFVRPGTDPRVLPAGESCPLDMAEVEGDYCPLVEQRCLRWLDAATKLQCAEFEKTAASPRCSMKTQQKKFCMDRYEWPNHVGVLPVYMASWHDAKAACEGAGKRLCADTEWTLACEGPDRHPYPYGSGFERDATACNVDKPYVWPRADRLFDPNSSPDELSRLDQREPSGSRPACVSPYGVYDMVGNVDEWVVNESQSGQPHLSGLKGGYWGPVRTRCRPMTTGHDEKFRYYQTGFRCCGEVRATEDGDAPMASNF